MESSSGGGGGLQKPLSSKVRAPPPPKKLMTCNPEDVKIRESDIPNTFSSSHRRGLLKQSNETAKEPQVLAMKKLSDGAGLYNEADAAVTTSKKVDEKILTRSDEKLLKTFYGMFYTNRSSGSDWKLEVDGFIPVCLLQSLGNVNKPFRIIAMRGSVRIMEFEVTATTKITRTKVFVKWNDSRETMYGARFGKEDQAEQFHSTICRMVSTLSKTAQLLRQPERKMVLRKISDPENSASSTLRRMKVSLLIKLPDKQTTIMSVPGLLTMSELFELICKKEALDPACHQLSLPRVGNRKLSFDSETAVGSLKIREVCIINVGTRVDAISENTTSIEGEIVNLVDVQEDESKILNIQLPGQNKKAFRVPLDMSMKILVGKICSQENLNPRFHSLQYLDFKHDFLNLSSTVKDIDSTQLRLMDKRGRNTYTRKSLPDDTSLTLTHNHSDMSRHHMGNYKQRQSSADELDSSSRAFVVAEAGVSPKRFSTPSLLEDLPAEFPGHQQNGGKVDKPAVPQKPNGSATDTRRRNLNEAPAKARAPPPRPLPYASRPARPPRSQEDPILTNRGLVQDKALSPIVSDMKTKRYASSPNLLANGRENASEASSMQIRTSTPEKKRRVAPPPPKPPRTGGSQAPSQGQMPPSQSVTGTGLDAAVNTGSKPSVKKRPAPPRPSRPPPATRRSSAGEASEVVERARQGIDPDVVRPESKKNPPMFIAPPPPSDLPPPIDECETPVGPLTDEDFFYGRSPSSRNGSFLNGFSVDEEPSSALPSVYLERSANSEDSDVFLESPLKGTTKTERNELPLHDKGPPSPGPEADVLPMVPPPVQFSESSESSRVGTPDIDGSVTPPLEPHEMEVPLRIAAIVMQEEEVASEPVEVKTREVEPQLTLEQRASADTDQDSDSQEICGEITVVPPPPPPNHSDEKMKQTEEPDAGSSLDNVSSIPPPDGFGTSSGEWEPESPKPLKKKLGIDEALFPWMSEPPPPINAAIPVAVVQPEPGFEQGTEELPPPTEFESVAQPEVTETHLSEPPASEHAAHPEVTATQQAEVTSRLHKEVTPATKPGVSAVSTPQVQLKANVTAEVDSRVRQEVVPDLRTHTRDVMEKTEMQRPGQKAGGAQEVALKKVAPSAVKPETKPKSKPKVPVKSWNKPTPTYEPYQAVTPDVVSQTETQAVTELVPKEEMKATDALLRSSEAQPMEKNVKQYEQPRTEVQPEAVVCEVRPDVESRLVLETLMELKSSAEPEAVEIEQQYQVKCTQVAVEPGEPEMICETPVVAETSSLGRESLNLLEDRFKDLEEGFIESSETSDKSSKVNYGAGKSVKETDLIETSSSDDPFVQPLLDEELRELEEGEESACQPTELPTPPLCSPPKEIPTSSSLPSPLPSPKDENQRAEAVEPANPKDPLPNLQHVIKSSSSTFVSPTEPSTSIAESIPQDNSNLPSHRPVEKFKRPLSVPPDLLNFDQVKVATEPSKEHALASRSLLTAEVETSPASVSAPIESRKYPLELSKAPPLRGNSSRAGTASFITSAAKKESKAPVQETKSPSLETKITSKETNISSQETIPRVEKPPRPPVPLKRPHSWVAPDVGKKPSSLPFSSAYKPKEFKAVAFSAKPEVPLPARPNAETPANGEGGGNGSSGKIDIHKQVSGKENQLDATKPAEVSDKQQELDVTKPAEVSGKGRELNVAKPAVVSEKKQELDLTKPAVVFAKEEELDITKPAVVSERETVGAKPDVTTNGNIGMKIGNEQIIPPAEREGKGKRPGIFGLINTFSAPVEKEKSAITKTNTTGEDRHKEDTEGAPKSSFVNPSRGKYAVLFPNQDPPPKMPETARVGSTSHAKQDGAESKPEPLNKDPKPGLSSLSSRQKYNVLFAGTGTAAGKPGEDVSTISPNQPASKRSEEKPEPEQKPNSSVVAGKTFEIIFADDVASKSKLDNKPDLLIKEGSHSSEKEVTRTETKADAKGDSVAAVVARKNNVQPAVGFKPVTKSESSAPVGFKTDAKNESSAPLGFKPVTKNESSAPVGFKAVTKNESSAPVGFKSVTKSESSAPVAEEKKKVPPVVGTKPVGTSLKRADMSTQQQTSKGQPVPVSIVPKPVSSAKGFKLKMMAKDSTRDTDIVPRGLVATLKARAAQEESTTSAAELNNNTA